MTLSESAKKRLRLAKLQGLFIEETEESLIKLILSQEVLSESNHLTTISFDFTDLISENK